MAKEIMGISQLNGMTQTNMIHQICVLQWSVWGHGNMTSLNANNKDKVLKITDLAKSIFKEVRRSMRRSKLTS